MTMRLEQESQPPLSNPDWQEVESALRAINPKGRSFFILSDARGSYVQAAGARLRLIVEHRQTSFWRFRHYVLGRAPERAGRISVNYSGGAIALHRNEVLTIEDAIAIFRCFYETDEVPEAYVKRDVTAEQHPQVAPAWRAILKRSRP